MSFGFTGVEGDPKNAWSFAKTQKMVTYFAGPPLLEAHLLNADEAGILRYFETLREGCEVAGFRFCLRLHPKTKKIKNNSLVSKIFSSFDISSNSLIDDALQSQYIIGCGSTSLLRAAFIGCPVYNLVDQGDVMGIIPDIESKEFIKDLKNDNLAYENVKAGFDVDGFSRFINELLK